MRKLNYTFIFILVISITFYGCDSKLSETHDGNLVKIHAPIEQYTLTMSSVPGLPLEFLIDDNQDNKDLVIKVSVEAGNFVQWDNKKIEILGDNISLDFKDTTIYWTPIVKDSVIEDNEIELRMSLIDNVTKEIIDAETYIIAEKEGVYRLLQIVFTDK